MMLIFSNTAVEVFCDKRVVILILPIKIMPDTKYEFHGVRLVLGTEKGMPHTSLSLRASLQLYSSKL